MRIVFRRLSHRGRKTPLPESEELVSHAQSIVRAKGCLFELRLFSDVSRARMAMNCCPNCEHVVSLREFNGPVTESRSVASESLVFARLFVSSRVIAFLIFPGICAFAQTGEELGFDEISRVIQTFEQLPPEDQERWLARKMDASQRCAVASGTAKARRS